MSKFKASDFSFEEDYILSAECEDCGYYTEKDEEFEGDCPECGGNLINSTSHEDCRCAICQCHIDMWDDVYRHDMYSDVMICEDCYEDLECEE